MFLTSASQYPIGLDISDLSLKLFQLDKHGDKITVQAASKVNLPKGLINDGEIINRAEVIKVINDLVSNPKFGKTTTNEIVACLPESKTFVKLIEIDKNPNDIAEVIRAEVEKHIPMATEEIYFDWQIIKSLPGKDLVLIGAAARSIVDEYTSLFDEAGFSVAALEIESLAVCRALLAEENYKFKGSGSSNYAIIDIGAKRTSMIIYSQNTIVLTINMPISGEKITESIAQNLQIDMNQAEKAKIVCGLDENKAEGVIKEILEGMLSELISHIADAIKFYTYHFNDRGPIAKIILCGGGANISQIDKIIHSALNIEVALADVTANLEGAKDKFAEIIAENHRSDPSHDVKSRDANLALAQSDSLSFATAIGLALRGLLIDEL